MINIFILKSHIELSENNNLFVMKLFFFIQIFPLFFFHERCVSQNKIKIDSIINLIKSENRDTSLCLDYIALANEYWNENPTKMLMATENAIMYAGKCMDKKFLSMSYHSKASALGFLYKLDSALYYDKLSLELYRFHKNDFQLWSSLHGYGDTWATLGNVDSAMKYIDSAISLIKNSKYNAKQNLSYLAGGNCLYRAGRLNEAETYYIKGLKLAEKEKDSSGMSQYYNNYGSLKIMQGKISDTIIQYLNTAIDYYKSVGNKVSMANSISTLASALTVQKNYPDAIKYYKEGLELSAASFDTNGMATNFINISESYYLSGKYDSAAFYADSGIYYSTKIIFTTGMFLGKAIKANHLIDKGLFNDASMLLEEVYVQAGNIKDQYSLSYITLILGKYYFKLEKYDVAIKYLNQAIQVAVEMKNNLLLIQDYDYLQQCYLKTGNYKEAYKFLNLYSALKDSVNNENSQLIVNRLNTQYKAKEKDLIISRSNIEKDNLRQRNIFLLLGIILSILIGAYIFYLLRKTQKQKKILQQLNRDIKSLQDVMRHETLRHYGDIAKSASLMPTSSDPIRTSKKLFARTNAYISLYQTLFISSQKDKLSLSIAIENVFNDNVIGLDTIPMLNIEGDIVLNFREAEYLLLALNELIANSLEHAFIDTANPQINISISQLLGFYIVEYQDNGKGITDDKRINIAGKGMRQLNSLVTQNLNGKLAGSNNSIGSYYKITFKI